MVFCMAFYHISRNISFCIQNVHIYNYRALYIICMYLRIFMGTQNENMKFYIQKCMVGNLNYILCLSINDCKHLFYHIWMSILHEKVFLCIKSINWGKDGRILKSDCIFISKLFLLFFNCIFLHIYDHSLNQQFFLSNILLFRKIIQLAIRNLLQLNSHS